jgi:voltage-gated potassium channel
MTTGSLAPRAQRPPSARLRWRALARFEQHVEPIMAWLGLVWLGLFILDMTAGLNPLLGGLSTIIWILFIADFAVRLLLAPHRLTFLRRRWLTALSLIVPALRVAGLFVLARAMRAARAVRGVRLVRAVGSLNRGINALGKTLHRRGALYVIVLTIAVTLAGAAGMYALEPHAAGANGFHDYGDALWWTAMLVTTIGSAYWPQTPEGRILAFLISLFSIAVFGYVTATLASFFIDRDAASNGTAVAGSDELRSLRNEIAALRRDLALRGSRGEHEV